MYYLAAGGAACVVQRDCPVNHIISSHFMSDGSFAWDVYVPQGGSAAPMTAQGLATDQQNYLDVMDPVGMKQRLEKLSLSNWLVCIDKALAKAGYTRQDVDYLATLLVKRSAHDYLMEQLGLEPGADPLSGGVRPPRPERPDTFPGAGPGGGPAQAGGPGADDIGGHRLRHGTWS